VRISLPVEISQILMVLSSLPEAIVLPSLLNATLLTDEECPVSVRISLPVEISQILIVLSSLPEAIVLPSLLNATLLQMGMSRKRAN
jgi:hypothetical protein